MTAETLDPRRPFWTRGAVLAAGVLAIAALKLVVSAATDLIPDEGYYTLWSLYPSFGYLDHPPMVAWLIALGRLAFGETELGVRVVSALTGVAVAAALHRIGVLLFDRKTAALAVIWYTLTPFAALTFLATPDAASILFWVLALWAVAEVTARGNANWWLLAGALAGLGLSSKLTNGFLPLGLLLYLLVSAARRPSLRRWQVWGGAVLAAVAIAPVVWWNATHEWVTVWFQGRRIGGAESFGTGFFANLGEFAAGQLLVVGPVLAIAAVAGVVVYALGKGGSARRGLALAVVTSAPLGLYLLFHTLHSRVEANWLLPAWPGLILAAAWAVTRLPRWLPIATGVAQAGFGLILIAVVFAQALVQPFVPSPPFDRTRDLAGWSETWAEIAKIADENGARWIAVDGDYGLTGELASYATFAGSALPVHQIGDRLRYRFRPFEPDAMGWPALYVVPAWTAPAQAAPETWFGTVSLAGTVARKRGTEVIEEFRIYVVAEPNAAFTALSKS